MEEYLASALLPTDILDSESGYEADDERSPTISELDSLIELTEREIQELEAEEVSQTPPPLPPRNPARIQSRAAVIEVVREERNPTFPGHTEWLAKFLGNPENQEAIAMADMPDGMYLAFPYSLFYEDPMHYPEAVQLFQLDARGECFRNPFLHPSTVRVEKEEVGPLGSEELNEILPFVRGFWLPSSPPTSEHSPIVTNIDTSVSAFLDRMEEELLSDFDDFWQLAPVERHNNGSDTEESVLAFLDELMEELFPREKGEKEDEAIFKNFSDVHYTEVLDTVYHQHNRTLTWIQDTIPQVDDYVTRGSISDYSSGSITGTSSPKLLLDDEPVSFSPMENPFSSDKVIGGFSFVEMLREALEDLEFFLGTWDLFSGLDVEELVR